MPAKGRSSVVWVEPPLVASLEIKVGEALKVPRSVPVSAHWLATPLVIRVTAATTVTRAVIDSQKLPAQKRPARLLSRALFFGFVEHRANGNSPLLASGILHFVCLRGGDACEAECLVPWSIRGGRGLLAWHLQLTGKASHTPEKHKHQTTQHSSNMKSLTLLSILLVSLSLSLAVTSCKEEKGPAGKVGEKIDDALDARPAEGLRDAAEDLTK